MSFVSILTDEKKKIREFKYTILINSEFVEEVNHYYSIIHDKNGKQTKLHLVCEMTEIESYIRRLTQSIKHILELVPYDYHSYCLFTIKSNNVYFLNLLIYLLVFEITVSLSSSSSSISTIVNNSESV